MNWICSKIDNIVKGEKRKLFESLHELRKIKNEDLTICEIGSGPGVNFEHYPEGSKLICVEPKKNSETSIKATLQARNPSVVLEKVICGGAEDLSALTDESVDVVVATLVLCCVKDSKAVLQEVTRILKPKGKFYFMEHLSKPEGKDAEKNYHETKDCHENKDKGILVSMFSRFRAQPEKPVDALTVIREANYSIVEPTEFLINRFWLPRNWVYGVATK